MTATHCPYCGTELKGQQRAGCDWCSEIIQQANCEGIYLIDIAAQVGQRDDLTTIDERRAAIQQKYDAISGR